MTLIGTREIAPIGPVFKRSSMLFAENSGRCAAQAGWNRCGHRTARDRQVQAARIVLSNLGHSLAES